MTESDNRSDINAGGTFHLTTKEASLVAISARQLIRDLEAKTVLTSAERAGLRTARSIVAQLRSAGMTLPDDT